MKIFYYLLILAVIGIAIADTSDVSDTEVTTKYSENDETFTGSSEERQPIRPVFPKSVREFILTTESTTETNVMTPVNRPYKKPVLKIVQKAVKMKHKSYWKSATRRPSLMKNKKFTVDPVNSNKHRYLENVKKQSDIEIQRKHDVDQFRKTMSSNKDDSSEESSETTEKEKRKDKIKHVKTLMRRFHKLRSKINREKNREKTSKFKESVKLNMNTDVNTVKPNENEFASQDKEDREEFIFVTPKTQERATTVEEDSEKSDEATTMTLEKELKFRQKRSINVIEEENLGTTVSGFKFTGKVNSMNSNLVFMNINT